MFLNQIKFVTKLPLIKAHEKLQSWFPSLCWIVLDSGLMQSRKCGQTEFWTVM